MRNREFIRWPCRTGGWLWYLQRPCWAFGYGSEVWDGWRAGDGKLSQNRHWKALSQDSPAPGCYLERRRQGHTQIPDWRLGSEQPEAT